MLVTVVNGRFGTVLNDGVRIVSVSTLLPSYPSTCRFLKKKSFALNEYPPAAAGVVEEIGVEKAKPT